MQVVEVQNSWVGDAADYAFSAKCIQGGNSKPLEVKFRG
jgi:hypothetical protein